jgi:hypothetical protein
MFTTMLLAATLAQATPLSMSDSASEVPHRSTACGCGPVSGSGCGTISVGSPPGEGDTVGDAL